MYVYMLLIYAYLSLSLSLYIYTRRWIMCDIQLYKHTPLLLISEEFYSALAVPFCRCVRAVPYAHTVPDLHNIHDISTIIDKDWSSFRSPIAYIYIYI